MNEILKVEKLEKYYGGKSNLTKALNDVSFHAEKENL